MIVHFVNVLDRERSRVTGSELLFEGQGAAEEGEVCVTGRVSAVIPPIREIAQKTCRAALKYFSQSGRGSYPIG